MSIQYTARGSRSICFALLITLGLSSPGPAAAFDPPADAPAAPRFLMDSIDFDFGVTGIESPLEHEFTFKNAGNALLEITRIDPTYGCTVAGEPPRFVEPGQSAGIRIALNPEFLRGRFEKQVVLNTNDRSRETIVLTLRGELRRLIEIAPPAAGFGRLDPKEYVERAVTLTNNSDKPFKLTMDPPSPSTPFDFQLVETIKGWEYKLFVGSRPPFKPGTIRAEAILHSNVKSQETLKVAAYAIISERLEVTPTSLAIAPQSAVSDKATSGFAQSILFSNHGEKPVKLVGVSCTDSSVMTSMHEIVAGSRYRVIVELPANYHMSADGARVLLMTDDEEMPTLDVPLGSTRPLQLNKPRPAVANAANTGEKKPARKSPVLEMIGKKAPTISLTTVDGAPISNEDIGYHPATVLDFFAANCGYCKKQIPNVEKLRAIYETRGVRFVNICETMRTPFQPDEVRGVLSGLGANLEFAMDPGNKVGRDFKVTGFPALFVIRPDGTIEHVVSGNKQNLIEDVTEKLETLLSAETASHGSRADATQNKN